MRPSWLMRSAADDNLESSRSGAIKFRKRLTITWYSVGGISSRNRASGISLVEKGVRFPTFLNRTTVT
jgi:hypothetical protein